MRRDGIIAKWERLSPRGRDSWIAAAIFGWSVERVVHAEYAWELGVCGAETIPYYSTEIAAAWSVVEVCGSEIIVRKRINGFTCRAWYDGQPGHLAWGRAAPEAIGLAALLAKLAED